MNAKMMEAFKKNAAIFLARHDIMGLLDARAEVDMIVERIGIEAFAAAPEATYIRMTRKGAKVALDRKTRRVVADLLFKALNHADFEAGDWKDEA